MLFGLVMFVAAFPIIYWNEGRAVRTARSLTEGLGAVARESSRAICVVIEARFDPEIAKCIAVKRPRVAQKQQRAA